MFLHNHNYAICLSGYVARCQAIKNKQVLKKLEMKIFETTCHAQSIMDAQFISFHHIDIKVDHIITMPSITGMSYSSKNVPNSGNLMQFGISICLTYINGGNLIQFRISICLTLIKLAMGWKFRLGNYTCFKKMVG